MSQDLLKQIDDLVASKTFNLDALDGIKQLKDSLKKTLEERDSLQRRHDALYETNREQSEQLIRGAKREELLRGELASAKELNDAGQKAIYDADKHKAVAEAWQGAMAMVFKPNAVREAVQRNHTVIMPSPGGGGYPQSVSNTDSIVREDA